MTKVKEKKNDDLVLVAKVGKEQEFENALEEVNRIANGSLGFRGQAELMIDMDLFKAEPQLEAIIEPIPKEDRVDAMEKLLKQIYLEKILSLSEEVTPEEADKRRKATKVLYGK